MNTPTWYLPALSDDVLKSLRTDAESVVSRFAVIARIEQRTLTPDERQAFDVAEALRNLINYEFEYRQTVRLAVH